MYIEVFIKHNLEGAATIFNTYMVAISLRSAENFMAKCGVDTMAPNLFSNDLPNKAL